MTRIVVPRGSGGSSSNANRPPPQHVASAPAAAKEEDHSGHQEVEERARRKEEVGAESSHGVLRIEGGVDPSSVEVGERRRRGEEAEEELGAPAKGSDLSHLRQEDSDSVVVGVGCGGVAVVSSCPPPPPAPPPNASSPSAGTRRMGSGGLGTARNVSSRRQTGWPPLPAWGPQPEPKPSSPKSFGDAEGYNSADEQRAYFGPPYCNPALECRTVLEDLGTRTNTEDITEEKEMMFEIEIKGVKGLEIKKMAADGNCLFRAVADQVYGDAELYDTSRQMCIDYMERERDHFSQFIVENFTAYCKRKRRDKIHGNNIEIQAFAEMYNRPIHIYCYSTEPINIFHGGYDTDTPPIRLSYHHGNHYNSLVDPRRLAIGAGLGLSSLRGANDIDKDQVKAAIKAQQDQQIENALLAEGRFYSDLELTEREIERMVMEASRAEYLAEDRFKEQHKVSSASAAAEPSSSGGRSSDTGAAKKVVQESTKVLSDSMNVVLAMGFSYLQAIEAYSIFGDDVDSMVCYLVETGASDSPGSSRQKGKAAE